MNEQMHIRAEMDFMRRHIGVWLYQELQGGDVMVSTNVTMEKVEWGQVMPRAPIQLDIIAAQSLVDQLWQAGIMPSQGSGSAGSLAATERHLEDMRSLVFKTEPKK
jgi:hypothetical protein